MNGALGGNQSISRVTGKSGERLKGVSKELQTSKILPCSPVRSAVDKLYWAQSPLLQATVSHHSGSHDPTDPIPQAAALIGGGYGLLHLLLWEGKAELADQGCILADWPGQLPRELQHPGRGLSWGSRVGWS